MVFLRAKVVVIGDSCVGKSALCQVLGSDGGMYPKSYTSTIMTDLIIKQIPLTDTNDTVELFLHDNSGKAMYFENCKETWLSADMICIVFDITNKDSFGHSKFWFDKVNEVLNERGNDGKKIIGCVVGNKSDLDQRRIVNSASAKQFAESINLKYFECSAKDNQNILDPFRYMSAEYVKSYKQTVNLLRQIE